MRIDRRQLGLLAVVGILTGLSLLLTVLLRIGYPVGVAFSPTVQWDAQPGPSATSA